MRKRKQRGVKGLERVIGSKQVVFKMLIKHDVVRHWKGDEYYPLPPPPPPEKIIREHNKQGNLIIASRSILQWEASKVVIQGWKCKNLKIHPKWLNGPFLVSQLLCVHTALNRFSVHTAADCDTFLAGALTAGLYKVGCKVDNGIDKCAYVTRKGTLNDILIVLSVLIEMSLVSVYHNAAQMDSFQGDTECRKICAGQHCTPEFNGQFWRERWSQLTGSCVQNRKHGWVCV